MMENFLCQEKISVIKSDTYIEPHDKRKTQSGTIPETSNKTSSVRYEPRKHETRCKIRKSENEPENGSQSF